MKGHGLVHCYFPWAVQHYYSQVLAFTNKLGLRLVHFCAKHRPGFFVKVYCVYCDCQSEGISGISLFTRKYKSIRLAEWLPLSTLDHEVPDFNPVRGGIQLLTVSVSVSPPPTPLPPPHHLLLACLKSERKIAVCYQSYVPNKSLYQRDKRGYPNNKFLILHKNMLWVLARSASAPLVPRHF